MSWLAQLRGAWRGDLAPRSRVPIEPFGEADRETGSGISIGDQEVKNEGGDRRLSVVRRALCAESDLESTIGDGTDSVAALLWKVGFSAGCEGTRHEKGQV